MLDEQKSLITTAASGIFDRVLDSFDGINMLHHINENLCFVGIKEYGVSESKGDGARNIAAVYQVTLLGRRGLSASELSTLVDDELIPTLYADSSVREITRHTPTYSKEQQRHMLSIIVKFEIESESSFLPEFKVYLDGISYSIFDECVIDSECKLYQLATVTGEYLQGIKSDSPLSVTLKAHGSVTWILKEYSELAAYKQSHKLLVINGVTIGALLVSGVTCDINENGATLTLRLTEVNA